MKRVWLAFGDVLEGAIGQGEWMGGSLFEFGVDVEGTAAVIECIIEERLFRRPIMKQRSANPGLS